MGEAFASGLKNKLTGISFGVADKAAARVEIANKNYGAVDFTGKPGALLDFADITIIAVKPQDAAEILRELAPHSAGKKFAALIAGKPLEFYAASLKTPYIARFMPSIAAMYQKAAVGVAFHAGDPADAGFAAFRAEALELAAAAGEALEIPEKLMAVITGMSGSGIAFAFSFIHALALGGVKGGLGYDKALGVAAQVAEGAAAVLRGTGLSPADLITKVCSPAGTTIAGIQALEESAFTAAVMRAVEEATCRAEELEGA
ncbi:MAG: NAD(P)-binding domain-containing protein [Spirochaetaceae bacterium]|nr:NAD(P)-binding domain-containing protein [Spirochaetaceae bacterium]